MPKRLLITLLQVKAVNTSEKLFNKIRQIVYSLCRANEITKKVYHSTINSIKILYKMDTAFMNYENGKTSDPHGLILNLLHKIDLKKES